MFSRRAVVAAPVALAVVGAAHAASATKMRLSWPSFIATADYQPYVETIRRMRANTNASDSNSWLYWANVHENFCPHGVAYFLAWHRGLLHLFEEKIAEQSGIADFRLPYWDYYTSPTLPVEFTKDGVSNPLWVRRVGGSVAGALTLEPFLAKYTNFQRGAANAFEPQIESKPHNPVHNLIGGVMTSLQSPQDPIFWVHHGNIDRLWTAWTLAGGGRTMPPAESDYWAGDFNYAPGLTLNRLHTRDGLASFGDVYENTAMPTQLPPPAPKRPAVRALRMAKEAAPSANLITLGTSGGLTLGDQSFSVQAPLSRKATSRVRALNAAPGAAPAAAAPGTVTVVLDGVTLTELGKRGGYYYEVFLNLPPAGKPAGAEDKYLLGTLGPFEIASAAHHMAGGGMGGGDMPVNLSFPASSALARIPDTPPGGLVVSFVRVDAAGVHTGDAIHVRNFRIEVGAAQ